MSRIQFVVLVVLLAVIAAMVTLPIVMPKAPLPATKPQTFEYKVIGVPDLSFDKDMAKLGELGWDLVTARRATTGSSSLDSPLYECIFKRVTWTAPKVD